jgi:hypothetical protein
MPDLEDEIKEENATKEVSLMATKPIIRRQAEDYKMIYANNAQVGTAVYDIHIDLALTLEVRDDAMVVEDKLRVYMSPAHAKALCTLLAGSVFTYEQNFGALPNTVQIPPHLENLLRGAMPSENDDKTTQE